MSEAAVEQFRTILASRFGWRVHDDRGQLAQVLARLVPRRSSPFQYLESLAAASPASDEVREVAQALAVSETYFFRDPEQFAAFAEVMLPALAAQRSAPIRILSAGAASGEEAYSIAMAVLQVQQHRSLPPIEILGIDVSARAIAKARAGRYSAWALRGLPSALRTRFFATEGSHFDVLPEVRRMVRFEERNLLDLERAAPGTWDVAFFRNTFMYFTTDAAREVFRQLAAKMAPGGFLFLGHAETLRGVSDAFALRQFRQTFYYVREPADGAAAIAPVATTPAASGDLLPAEWLADDAWFHEIARATERVASLVDGRRTDDAVTADVERQATKPAPADMTDALALLAEERYDAALAALGDGRDPERLLLKAVLLVHAGRIDEARASCRAVLAADSLHAGAYYVQALCDERAGNVTGAVRNDEMAIYLDDTFAMPHLHLALVAQRRGDRDAARRHAQRAHTLFSGEDRLRILLFGGGFDRTALLKLCESYLRRAS